MFITYQGVKLEVTDEEKQKEIIKIVFPFRKASKKERVNRAWTKEDEDFMRESLNAGGSYEDIARKMNRNAKAVEIRAARMFQGQQEIT